MKKNVLTFVCIFVVTGTILSTSCQKEDLLTQLSHRADPTQAAVLDTTDTGGMWVAKKKIGGALPNASEN